MKLVVLAAAACAAAGVYFLTGPSFRETRAIELEGTKEPITQVAQQKPFVAKGFEGKAPRVEELHRNVVETLNDLDLAYGMKREKTPTGEVIVNVPPRYGMSRMDMTISHNGKSVWTKNKRQNDDPWMLVFSANGKPLTAENIEEQNVFGQNPLAVAAQREMRKRVAAANFGQEFGFETTKHYGWAKPLKLTKIECLSCHSGMKVGDTVAINAFLLPKDAKDK